MGVGALLLAVIALLAACRATIIMIYLGFAFSDQVNPITTPLSYYVFVDGGEQLVDSAVAALVIGVLAVLLGMAWLGVRLAGRPTVLFGVWCLCLVMAAMFPTDDSPNILTFGGWVHQFAGAGILALLSFAGFAAAPRLAEQPAWRPVVGIVRALSAGAAVLAAAYVVTRIEDVFPWFAVMSGGIDPGGIIQRMVLVFDGAVVAALAVQLVRVAWLSVRPSAEQWPAVSPTDDPPAAPHTH